MAVTQTPRLGITRWGAGTDPFTRAQRDSDNAKLDDLVALDGQGTFAERPAAGTRGRYYYVTTGTNAGRLYRDTGTAWEHLNPSTVLTYGTSATASAPGDTGEAGSTGTVADAGHRHAREAAPTQTTVLHSRVAAASNYTVAAAISLVLASGTITVTLPAATAHASRQIIVKNTGTGTVTVASAGGLVEEAASASLPSRHSITVVSDGTDWQIV